MPTKTKKDPRDEVGTIVHAVANRVLSDHTAKNIVSNVNYAKHFLQGSVAGVFNGSVPGGKNAIWKLTVDFEMPSNDPVAKAELKRVDVHWQHCIFGPIPAGKKPPCSITFTDSIGIPDHAVKGLMTYLPNTEGRVAAASATTATANKDDDNDIAAPCDSLSLAAPLVVAAPADNDIEFVVPLPPPPPKKKRKKATSLPRNDASTATPLPTAPSTKKSKAKQASKSVNLCENPVWVVQTNGKRHRVVVIAHERKWVTGVAEAITGDVTKEHPSIHQWCHKDPFGKMIGPGNPEYSNMSPLQAFLHMMPTAQLTMMLELTNQRLVEKEKQKMSHQELLQWIDA